MILITVRDGMISSITTDAKSQRYIPIKILDFDPSEVGDEIVIDTDYAAYDPKFIATKFAEAVAHNEERSE